MYAYDEPKENKTLSGKKMATIMQKHIVSLLPETYNHGPVKNSSLAVLRHTEMPAVIIEGLFVSNDNDRKMLGNDDILSKIAKAVYEGILEITD